MIAIFNGVVSMFPVGVQALIRILFAVFVLLTVLNIVLTVVWVVNEVKELFHIV